MAGATEIAADIVAAGSATAGLMLVYMGALSTGFSAFEPQERRSVSGSYRRRMWFAFVGLLLLLASVALALFGKLLALACMDIVALVLLLVGLGWLLATAILTALEIK